MNLESYREYCLSKKGTTEEFPFDENTLVFKVGGKMFALTNLEQFEHINLKCNPEKAITLREEFQGISPGYHINKKHWNSILLKNDISDQLILELTDHSYNLVVCKLPKKIREELID